MNATYLNQQIKLVRVRIKNSKEKLNQCKKFITALKTKIKSEQKKLTTATNKAAMINKTIGEFRAVINKQMGVKEELEHFIEQLNAQIYNMQDDKRNLPKKRR